MFLFQKRLCTRTTPVSQFVNKVDFIFLKKKDCAKYEKNWIMMWAMKCKKNITC